MSLAISLHGEVNISELVTDASRSIRSCELVFYVFKLWISVVHVSLYVQKANFQNTTIH